MGKYALDNLRNYIYNVHLKLKECIASTSPFMAYFHKYINFFSTLERDISINKFNSNHIINSNHAL